MNIGLATSGLWAHRNVIEHLSGAKAVRLDLLKSCFGWNLDAVAGWGHKPTANKARKIAAKHGLPYLAFEDGFLRSVRPGTDENPVSIILDRKGVYYNAREPSDLEDMVRNRMGERTPDLAATKAISLLRKKQLSKYNSFSTDKLADLELISTKREGRILVVDQTAGDASIPGAYASEKSFMDMLRAAVQENPNAEILVKVHPETLLRRKAGHFSGQTIAELATVCPDIAKAQGANRLRLTPEAINPWALLEGCSTVYCVSSQLGFEALMAGCKVVSFGQSFYSGYGLTDDRNSNRNDRRSKASLEALFGALYFDYCSYFDHNPFREIDFFEAVQILESRIANTNYRQK